jgi:hypothetical protein
MGVGRLFIFFAMTTLMTRLTPQLRKLVRLRSLTCSFCVSASIWLAIFPTSAAKAQNVEAAPRLRVTTGGNIHSWWFACSVSGGKSNVGILDALDADTLRLRLRDSSTVALPRAQISRMELSRGRSRLKGMITGALFGGIPGEIAFVVAFNTTDKSLGALSPEERTRRQNRNFNVIMTTWLGGEAIGALIGALVKREAWENVRLVPDSEGDRRFAKASCGRD